MSETVDNSFSSTAFGGFFSHLPLILWERRLWIIVPFALIASAGIAAALLIPPLYRSSATLLVQQQQLPSALVGGAYAGMLDKRMARIQQQLLSVPQLIEMIGKHGLYPEERKTKSIAEVADIMRGKAALTPVRSDIARDDPAMNNVAYQFSFDYREPVKAQAVAQDFVQRLVELEVSSASEQTKNTATFLQMDADRLAGEITGIERQIEGIKAANGTTLSSAGSMMLPGSGVSAGYAAQIASIQRDTAQLEAKLKTLTNSSVGNAEVAAATAALANARTVYSDNHPDVGRAEQRLRQAQRSASQASVPGNLEADLARAQIASNNATIQALTSASAQDQARTSAAVSAQSRAPLITEKIAQLQSRADQLRQQYQMVAVKLMDARTGVRMDAELKSEHLTVLDKPQIPSGLLTPNRPLIIGAALFLGLIFGLVAALARELIKRPIRGVSGVIAATGRVPLIVIPSMEHFDRSNRRWKRALNFLRVARAQCSRLMEMGFHRDIRRMMWSLRK